VAVYTSIHNVARGQDRFGTPQRLPIHNNDSLPATQYARRRDIMMPNAHSIPSQRTHQSNMITVLVFGNDGGERNSHGMRKNSESDACPVAVPLLFCDTFQAVGAGRHHSTTARPVMLVTCMASLLPGISATSCYRLSSKSGLGLNRNSSPGFRHDLPREVCY
jgi:hypothetical protein